MCCCVRVFPPPDESDPDSSLMSSSNWSFVRGSTSCIFSFSSSSSPTARSLAKSTPSALCLRWAKSQFTETSPIVLIQQVILSIDFYVRYSHYFIRILQIWLLKKSVKNQLSKTTLCFRAELPGHFHVTSLQPNYNGLFPFYRSACSWDICDHICFNSNKWKELVPLLHQYVNDYYSYSY